MKTLIADIETNNYLSPWEYDGEGEPKIWCIVGIDADSGEVIRCLTVRDFVKVVEERCYQAVVFHNGIEYDFPVMKQLGELDYAIARHTKTHKPLLDKIGNASVRIIDTLILSRLLFPDRFEHGLESWSREFNLQKPDTDFVDGSMDDILHRCEADCLITLTLYKKIINHLKGKDIKDAYAREKHVADINQRRTVAGVGFNAPLAEEHCATLDAMCKPLAERVMPMLPKNTALPTGQIKYPPKIRVKNDGTPSKYSLTYFGNLIKEIDGEFYVRDTLLRDWPADRALVTWQPTTMKHGAVVKQWLRDEGWKPVFWNKDKDGNKTTPKLRDNGNTCPHLLVMAERLPEINDFVLYNTLQHRRNTLKSQVNDKKGLLNHPRLKYDGRLPPEANTLGAVTRRFTHKTVANIPRASSVFGKEMRELFLP